ncbi:hypothetical protein ABIB57_005265, partial [Devosia sp. UYZn731]|uniref:hypothetical protein n=1 Tax=Devosia sp. UYZn731 TaxID=3156345 RepID=UPI0033999F5B
HVSPHAAVFEPSRSAGKSIQWIDLRREGHESYARMARKPPGIPARRFGTGIFFSEWTDTHIKLSLYPA